MIRESETLGTRALRVVVLAPPWFHVPPSGYGGVEEVIATLVEGLKRAGHDVTLVAAGEDRTSVRFVPTFASIPTASLGGTEGTAIEMAHSQLANRLLLGLDADIVHDHTSLGPLLAPLRDVPTIITVHGRVDGWRTEIYRPLEGAAFVAVSDCQRASGPEIPWAATVHNAVDVGSYPFEDEKDDFLLFLGRMHPTKGVLEAIQVARKADRRLIIASKCSEETEVRYLENEIRPMLGRHATFIGEVGGSRKRALLARVSALLFPIQWPEPFGLVMVEAMACGTPVIATNRGSVPEVVEDGVSGFIRDGVDQLADVCNATRDLDPPTIREYASNRFDGSRMTAGYEDVYRQVLEESTRPSDGLRSKPLDPGREGRLHHARRDQASHSTG
jgi:glycosyltransferase involved in cell wall biosynthesis